jgi:hypothetical protein
MKNQQNHSNSFKIGHHNKTAKYKVEHLAQTTFRFSDLAPQLYYVQGSKNETFLFIHLIFLWLYHLAKVVPLLFYTVL